MEGMAFQPTKPKLPSFLCVGAQKAGTTTLHSLLGLHPMIFLPPRKEIHYFSLHYKMGLEWYSDFFSSAKDNQLRGEITPYYLFHPYVAQRIAQDLDAARIIILLRDPVARTISHYAHACRLGFEDLSFEQALDLECTRLANSDAVLKSFDGRHQQHQECSYLSRSLYRDQVERYWNHFGRSNVLVLPCEHMFANPWDVMCKVFQFIGIPPCVEPAPELLATCKNKGDELSQKVGSILINRLRLDLDDSYKFASNCLGWTNDLSWLWTL